MKDYTLQGCPNLAHDKLSRSTKDIPSPRKTRSDSESRFTRYFDNGKTRPAKPPDAPTIPIGAAHISFSGQHRISQATSKTSPRVTPWWPRRLLGSGQHSKEHWSRGAKNKDDPWARENPREKVVGAVAGCSMLEHGYHELCWDITIPFINASIYLVKGGRLSLMPGVLFHSSLPSFRHTGVMFPDFTFLTRLGDLWDPVDSSL